MTFQERSTNKTVSSWQHKIKDSPKTSEVLTQSECLVCHHLLVSHWTLHLHKLNAYVCRHRGHNSRLCGGQTATVNLVYIYLDLDGASPYFVPRVRRQSIKLLAAVLLSHKPLPPQLQISLPVTDFLLWSTVKPSVYSIKPVSLHTVKDCRMATIHKIPAVAQCAALIVNPKESGNFIYL